MNLMYVTILLFAVTAAFGLAILLKWLSKKEVSKAVVYSHGIFAALGLVLLTVFALQHRDHYPQVALILFVIAAPGGFYMFFRAEIEKMYSPEDIFEFNLIYCDRMVDRVMKDLGGIRT